MFEREVTWLTEAVEEFSGEQVFPMINLGSGDATYRQKTQPWIERDLFAPLQARGFSICHADVRDGDGIDLRANILEDAGLEQLRAIRPRGLFCCHLFEHVLERAEFARRCLEILEPGGVLFFTGPYSYPFHRDPIDTMWRPTPAEVAALFPAATLIRGEILDVGKSYRDDVRRRPWIIHRQIVHAPFPFIQHQQWKRSMKKIYWLFNNYKVTCAVLRKSPATGND
jgi:hypothetical protein